jgi:TRAP transporter TAXI family solute receptor
LATNGVITSLTRLHLREWLIIAAPVVLAAVAGLWFAARFLQPAPPDRVTMATGVPGGGYAEFGEQYRRALAPLGIEVALRPTEGSVDNFELLRRDGTGVDFALVQSGVGTPASAPHLQTLGSVAFEPLWIFCRGVAPGSGIAGLRGRRVAIGLPGSGTRLLAREILETNNLAEDAVAGVHVTGVDGAEALLGGAVDCLFIIAAADAGIVRAIMHSPDVALLDMERADAYVRRLPFLSKVVLPRGVYDLERDLPPRDVVLIAPTAELLVRDTLHPAIQTVLLQAAVRTHGGPGMFNAQGEFPHARKSAFPVSPGAQRFHQSGPPFLQRYLPFWLANLVDRLLVMAVPIIAILLPLTRIVTPLYKWRVRSRIYRWYGELMFIENETRSAMTAGEQRDFEKRLDAIERVVNQQHPPLAYADQLYALRQHIEFVRRRLENAAIAATAPSDRGGSRSS